jgi:hypothetical protein
MSVWVLVVLLRAIERNEGRLLVEVLGVDSGIDENLAIKVGIYFMNVFYNLD